MNYYRRIGTVWAGKRMARYKPRLSRVRIPGQPGKPLAQDSQPEWVEPPAANTTIDVTPPEKRFTAVSAEGDVFRFGAAVGAGRLGGGTGRSRIECAARKQPAVWL